MKSCESCLNYSYDEETDLYECIISMDEDEYFRYMTDKFAECPFYRFDNEYKIVNKQI